MGCASSVGAAVGTAVVVGEQVQQYSAITAVVANTAGKVHAVDAGKEEHKGGAAGKVEGGAKPPGPSPGEQQLPGGPPPTAPTPGTADTADPVPDDNDPAWISKSTKQKLKIVLKATLKVGPSIMTELAVYVPAPGDKALLLLGDLAGSAHTAIANTEDISDLLERASNLMEIILDKHADLDDPSAPLGPKYKKLMSSLSELLKKIVAYAERYSNRLFIMRMLTRKEDETDYENLVEELGFLMVDATFMVSLDTNSMTAEMKAMMQEMKDEMMRKSKPSRVPDLVESMGGVQAVLADDSKMQQIVQELSGDQALSLQANANLTRIVLSGFKAVDAKMNRGPHSIIMNEDMMLLWREVVAMSFRLDWEDWWSIFPSRLRSIVQNESDVDQLESLLSSKEAKAQFERRFNTQGEVNCISVVEVDAGFPKELSVLEAIRTILGGKDILTGVAGRNMLPVVSATSAGRELQAAALIKMVQQQLKAGPAHSEPPILGAVCIVGSAGMHKTDLAITVGHGVLAECGKQGGAVFISLKEASTVDQVLARFAAALHINMDAALMDQATDIRAHIIAMLANVRAAFGGPMLLVLAHAPSAADIQDLIIKVAGVALVIMTSQVPVGEPHVQQFQVPQDENTTWATGGGSDLSREEAAQVEKLAGGVPLLVQLLAREVQEGRLNAQVIELAIGQAAAAGERTTAVLMSIMKGLPEKQLTDLGMMLAFPSSFDLEDAAAVLNCDTAQALVRLSALEGKGLLGMGKGGSSIHLTSDVCKAVSATASAEAQAQGLARFTAYTFKQLRDWAGMYRTPAGPVVLRSARQHVADISAALGRIAEASKADQQVAVADIDTVELAELLLPLGVLQLPACLRLWELLSGDQGADADKKASMLYMLARVQAAQFRQEEALTSVEAVLQLGGESKPALHAAMLRALCLARLGRPADGEAACAQALESCEKVLGAEAPGTILCTWVLAECFRARGNHEAAEARLRTALQLSIKVLGAQHPFSVTLTGFLTTCLVPQGKQDEAALLVKA